MVCGGCTSDFIIIIVSSAGLPTETSTAFNLYILMTKQINTIISYLYVVCMFADDCIIYMHTNEKKFTR